MRTTLVIPDAVYRRAKEAARVRGQTLSDYVTESIEVQLAGALVARDCGTYRIRPAKLGAPKVDTAVRESLYRAMEE